MEQSENRQWVVWALLGASVLLVGCLACGILFAVVLLGGFYIPVSQPPPRPIRPVPLSSQEYVEMTGVNLDTLEEGNNLARTVIEEAQADPSVMDSQDWRDSALSAENWIKSGYDVIPTIAPPNGYIAAHQSVLDAADQCYLLYSRLYDAADDELDELLELVDECATSIEEARTAIANP